MTTNPICIPLAAGDGLEETPSGRMSSEWLDAVWQNMLTDFQKANLSGLCPDWMIPDFTAAEFALLATMQGVGPEDAAKRLTGETE